MTDRIVIQEIIAPDWAWAANPFLRRVDPSEPVDDNAKYVLLTGQYPARRNGLYVWEYPEDDEA